MAPAKKTTAGKKTADGVKGTSAARRAEPDEAPAAAALDPDSVDDVTSFDIDQWLDDDGDAAPRRSLVVYRRADLRAELDQVEHEMRLAGKDGDESVATGGRRGLRTRWGEIARQIADSALTVTVRALTDDAINQANAAAKAEGAKQAAAQRWDDEDLADEGADEAADEADIEGLQGDERDALIRRRVVEARRRFITEEFNRASGEQLLVRSLVSPRLTITQVRRLGNQIGSVQRNRLIALIHQAAGEVEAPTAPFSQPSSPGRRGGTSSKASARRGRGDSPR